MLVATSIDNMVVGGPAYNCQVPLLPCFQPTSLQSTSPPSSVAEIHVYNTRAYSTRTSSFAGLA